MTFRCFYAALAIMTLSLSASAQSTFSLIYQMMQTHCSDATCHGAYSQTFNVTVPEADLYNALVNKIPSNAAAAARGDKLVDPGYVDRSFLLRKLSHEMNHHLKLFSQDEGDYMPLDTTKLPDNEIELVRQWILFGAPLTGSVIDTAVINRYYREGGNLADGIYFILTTINGISSTAKLTVLNK